MTILTYIALGIVALTLLTGLAAIFAIGFFEADNDDPVPVLRMTLTRDTEGRYIFDGVPIGPVEGFADYCGKLGRG